MGFDPVFNDLLLSEGMEMDIEDVVSRWPGNRAAYRAYLDALAVFDAEQASLLRLGVSIRSDYIDRLLASLGGPDEEVHD